MLNQSDVSMPGVHHRLIAGSHCQSRCNLTEAERAEARGWGERYSRVAMLLDQERAGVWVEVGPEQVQTVLDADKQACGRGSAALRHTRREQIRLGS